MMNVTVVMVLAMLLQSQTPQNIEIIKARAKKGNIQAQVQLGIAYATGDGVTANDSEAVLWFHKAAEKGNADGEYLLGEMYLTGRGVETSLKDGAKWMRRAAEHGDPRGQSNIAVLYARGQGVPKDEKEAAKWMQKAADQGLAAGQFGLGAMYAHGAGVDQNIAKAIEWYRKAADQGDAGAMNNLAVLLATSTDQTIRNPQEAVKFSQRAVESDGSNASYLDTLATAYFQAHRREEAVAAERSALKLKPDNLSYRKALEEYEAASQPTGH